MRSLSHDNVVKYKTAWAECITERALSRGGRPYPYTPISNTHLLSACIGYKKIPTCNPFAPNPNSHSPEFLNPKPETLNRP